MTMCSGSDLPFALELSYACCLHKQGPGKGNGSIAKDLHETGQNKACNREGVVCGATPPPLKYHTPKLYHADC